MRHWSFLSQKVRFPEEMLHAVIQELLDSMEDVISRVATSLPVAFPSGVAEPIFDGMRTAKEKFITGRTP